MYVSDVVLTNKNKENTEQKMQDEMRISGVGFLDYSTVQTLWANPQN